MHHVALQDAQATPIKPATIESLPDIPVGIGYGSSSSVIGDKAYFRTYRSRTVYEFSNNQWHNLPPCPINCFTIVSVDDMLTTVGGLSDPDLALDIRGIINQFIRYMFTSEEVKLYSYINTTWVEHFPPMPKGRLTPGAVYANNTLVVAGGSRYTNSSVTPLEILNTVEILNTANMRWSIVSSLPVPTNDLSTTICGDYVYIHTHDQEKYLVYKCSLRQLTQSQRSEAIWEKIAPLPVCYSSLVTVNGHLLAVGEKGSKNKNIIISVQYDIMDCR